MASEFFDNPPILNGSEEDKLRQLYGYLNTMSEKLNTALMNISIEQLAPETKTVIVESGSKPASETYDTLKSIIIKTAEIVRTEMDEISTTLETKVTALSSKFGTYEETLTDTITMTARGIMQDFDYEGKITALEDKAATTESYIDNMDGYIFAGILESGEPGIAIGVRMKDEDGSTIMSNKMATFTSGQLSFYNGGDDPVAYFSSDTFYITNGNVTNSMKMGRHIWKVLSDNGLALVKGES